jgi:Trk-type K+ transport systems, membrane components
LIHFKSIIRYVALIQILLAFMMLAPLGVAVSNNEDEAMGAFLLTIFSIFITSGLILFFTRKEKATIKPKDSYLLVTLTWLVATAFGAIPLYMTRTLPNYVQCYFEIMSGFTTTGATALTSIEDKLRSILFWRNMTNWLGGMGIVVLFVAILPLLGVKGTNLVSAESVGPTKDKLTPKIQQTAFALWTLYIVISLIETVFLLAGSVPLYDALTITFGTMGAAGFAIKNSSIGGFNSTYVEWVCIIFMTITSLNYALFYKLIKGNVRQVAKDSELRLFFGIVVGASALIFVNLLCQKVYPTVGETLRDSLFQVISVVTTTGFSTADYTLWPAFSRMILLTLFFIGGCAGSAGGGIKVVRIYILSKLAKNTIIKRLHPNAVSHVMMGDQMVQDDTIVSIAGFVTVYLATGLAGSILFSLSGFNFETCFSASFLLLGNIGIGFGAVGPTGNFSIFSNWTLAMGSFLMLVGRLELFTVYALFTKAFWKK